MKTKGLLDPFAPKWIKASDRMHRITAGDRATFWQVRCQPRGSSVGISAGMIALASWSKVGRSWGTAVTSQSPIRSTFAPTQLRTGVALDACDSGLGSRCLARLHHHECDNGLACGDYEECRHRPIIGCPEGGSINLHRVTAGASRRRLGQLMGRVLSRKNEEGEYFKEEGLLEFSFRAHALIAR